MRLVTGLIAVAFYGHARQIAWLRRHLAAADSDVPRPGRSGSFHPRYSRGFFLSGFASTNPDTHAVGLLSVAPRTLRRPATRRSFRSCGAWNFRDEERLCDGLKTKMPMEPDSVLMTEGSRRAACDEAARRIPSCFFISARRQSPPEPRVSVGGHGLVSAKAMVALLSYSSSRLQPLVARDAQ
jgi:hypothetical protein